MKNRNILLACATLLIIAFALLASGCDSSAPPALTAVAPGPAGSSTAASSPSPSISASQASPSAGAAGVATSPATVAAGPASSPTALSGQLRFLAFGEPSEAKAFMDVAKGFQDANPAVKITTEAVPGQANQLLKLATSFAAGDPPDVFVVDYRRLGLLQNAGVIQPVQKYLEQSTVIKASDFYTKPMLDFVQYQVNNTRGRPAARRVSVELNRHAGWWGMSEK